MAQQLNLAFFSDKTLLILDDRRVTRTSWQYQSSTWGFQKTIVLSVQKGVDYIRNNPNDVDVIMIDIDKPQAKVNPGLAVLEQIRSIPYDASEVVGTTAKPIVDRKPVPCVLVSYHRRNNHQQQPPTTTADGTAGVAAPVSSSTLSPYQGSSCGSVSPVSPLSPISLSSSIKGNKNSQDTVTSNAADAVVAVAETSSSFGQSTCTPNTMNSGMLVAKPWTCRNDRSSSVSSSNSNKCASPTAATTQFHPSNPVDADASVGHLIKPVKQSKLLPMFHGLMTGSWPLACSAAPDNDNRADERKKQLESLECLLVDDNPVNQKVISRILGRMGIVPELANNGQEAVALCRARSEAVIKAREEALARGDDSEPDPKIKQYDIIFMDIWMPVMSGHQATTEIRASVSGVTTEEPFIVAMTACVMPGDREKCIASGMNQYLSKPIRKEELCVILERWLDDRAKAEKELKLSNQRKLIQKKKREMLQKRSLAILTGSRAATEKQLEQAIVMDEEEDDEEEEGVDQSSSVGQEGEGGGVGLSVLDGESSSPMTDAADRAMRRRKNARLSNDPLLSMNDPDRTLGCRTGGGGGLKMVAVQAEECRLAREKSKAEARRKDGGDARSRGESITLQDPATGQIPLVDPNLLHLSEDESEEEEEDSDSEDENHQASRIMFPEGVQLDRVSSNATTETMDSFHTMDTTSDSFHTMGTTSDSFHTMDTTSDSFRTVRTHPDSSNRSSFADMSDTSSIRTVRG